MTTINERIQIVVNELFDGNRSELCRKSGVPIGTMSSILGERQSSPNIDILQLIYSAIAEFPVSVEWFFTGKGDMKRKGDVTKYVEETRPRIPYTAAAGAISIAMEGVTKSQCEQIPLVKAFPKYDFTIQVQGDSMTPAYNSGDEVACLFIKNSNFIQWGRVHVLDTAQGIVIKRIYDTDDAILCVSEFSEKYPEFKIPKSEIYSVSLVVGQLRL